MGLWDVTFKRLVRLRPGDLLVPVIGVAPHRAYRLLDKEMERLPATKSLDALVEDRRGSKRLYHLEFEAVPQSDSGRRVFEHYVLAHLRFPTRPLESVVYYLQPGRERRPPVDAYRCYADGVLKSIFFFDAVALWRITPATFLEQAGAPALWAMVPLCKAATLEDVGRAHRKIVRQVEKGYTRGELDAILYTLASTQFDRAALACIFKEKTLMESWAVKEWQAAARAEGILKGRSEGERMGIVKGERRGIVKGERHGRVEGLRLACRRAIAAKLPRVTQPIERLLLRIDNEATLVRLVGEVAAAVDAKAVRAVLQKHRARHCA